MVSSRRAGVLRFAGAVKFAPGYVRKGLFINHFLNQLSSHWKYAIITHTPSPPHTLTPSPLPRFWMGVELDTAHGKNSGSRSGVRYFTCKPNHGVFVLPSRVKRSAAKLGIDPEQKYNECSLVCSILCTCVCACKCTCTCTNLGIDEISWNRRDILE